MIPADVSPVSLATADFNRDGYLDLAIVSSVSSSGVAVRLGKGKGSFLPPVHFAVGRQPYAVAVGDLNFDGNADLVVANSLDDTISALLGNGDGTFQTAKTFSTGNNPIGVALGDFNGDGVLDVVTASTGVTVLLGNGDGTFQPGLDVDSEGAYSAAAGDFNGDGKLDLVVGQTFGFGSQGVAHVLIGNGDGTFEAGGYYSLHVSTPYSIAVGDLNHDGRQDLAVSTFDPGVDVFLGRGDGTFRSAAVYPSLCSSYGVVIADFNRDGKPDLAVAGFCTPGYMSVLS
ncbi:MAG: VCBS repeat-containing protein, partial [Acidobacteriales bacterium]|nr:VCBS repeat-containing protein [Terriglobales bacterium]